MTQKDMRADTTRLSYWTEETKNIIVEEAQKLVDMYFAESIMSPEIRSQYMVAYFAVAELYLKLTGKGIKVGQEDHIVREV